MRRGGRRGRTSVIDDVLKDAGRALLDDVGDSVRGLLRGAARRAAVAAAGLGALLAGVVLLLLAGAKALQAASLPPSAAYLGMGSVGLLAGLLLTRARR